ncbi:hypothetical protein JD844_031565 [Phrynosoma platyrhinos]|uniref:Interleukin 18 n=1 Tax=Phrynosoma platyrhinos TaxID=52577 RepID=A0ABQ7T123_PHRPL|nr:hypothetical protein JD844_031565 [Phrynosoma platyrhinos]
MPRKELGLHFAFGKEASPWMEMEMRMRMKGWAGLGWMDGWMDGGGGMHSCLPVLRGRPVLGGAKMTSDIVCMLPVHFSDGTLFFLEGLESDSWRKSGKCERTQILRNRDNYVLIARPDEDEDYKAVFQLMTDQAIQNVPGIKFNIHIYEDPMPRGLPVAFTTEWKSKTYYMCVVKSNNKMRVEFKEGDVPKRIDGQTSNVIFHKMSLSEGDSQFFRFESALEHGYFLAFERDESNITRLIVKKAMDEVDQTTEIYHSSFPPKR